MFTPMIESGQSKQWYIKVRTSAFFNLWTLNPELGTHHFKHNYPLYRSSSIIKFLFESIHLQGRFRGSRFRGSRSKGSGFQEFWNSVVPRCNITGFEFTDQVYLFFGSRVNYHPEPRTGWLEFLCQKRGKAKARQSFKGWTCKLVQSTRFVWQESPI